MPITLPIGRRVSDDDLALYVQVDGKLVDAYSVEYEVVDESDNSLVAPGASRQDMTVVGNFSTGCYGVYASGTRWTPTAELPRGKIVWYYTLEDGGDEIVVEREFAVVATSTTRRPVRTLARVGDMIDLGITSYTSAAMLELLVLWTKRVERYCRRSFFAIRKARRTRWRPGASVILDEDIFALASLRPTLETLELTLADYAVFGCATGDRDNPRIEVADNSAISPAAASEGITIEAVWGTVDEESLDAPLEIRATVAGFLVGALGAYGSPEFSVGPLKREKTDGHEVEYANVTSQVRSGMLGLFKSAELRDQLDLYRAPIGIAMTGSF